LPSREYQGWIFIPKDLVDDYTIYLDGVDVTADVISSEWTKGLFGYESKCELELIDDGNYSNSITGGETIELKFGSTSRWKGQVDKPKKRFGQTYTLGVTGSHFQNNLLNIMVTESYDGTMTDDAILKDLVSIYLTGYTTTNVAVSTNSSTINWDEKPLFDCILDLCTNSDFDCYLDEAKDFHFFEKESIENTDDAIIWDDNWLSASDGFGTDENDIRNVVRVYGEDEAGLPVIYETSDSTSETASGTREKVIKDSNIKNYTHAKQVGDATLAQNKDKEEKGEMDSLLIDTIQPGQLLWISHPIQHIHGQYRVVKYTHKLPILQTTTVISNETKIPTIFKDRKAAEQRQEGLTNPYGMISSFNCSFLNLNGVDTTLSSNIGITDGSLYMTLANGVMITNNKTESSNRTYFQLKVNGDVLAGNTYEVSTDGGSTFTAINLETETLLTAGTSIRIKITLTDANTRISGICLLMR
jgi:hypothetical protein